MNTFETEIIAHVELFRYIFNDQNKCHFDRLDEQREKPYIIKDIALREEDKEVVVIYQAQYDRKLTWVRPLSSWLEEIDGKARFINS